MWQLFSLLAGFCLASADALTKYALRDSDEFYVTWIRLLYTSIPLIIFAFFVPVPPVDNRIWPILLILFPLELFAMTLYVKAIKLSPISLVVPFLAFTPVFLLIIGFAVLREIPPLTGIIGVFMVSGGAYVISRTEDNKSIKAVLSLKGVRLMFLVSLLFSFTATLAKIAITYSEPTFFAVYYYILQAPFFLPILLLNYKGPIIYRFRLVYIFIGLFLAGMVIFHTIAISMTAAVNMIAVKRSNLLFSIIFGWLFFDEKAVGTRLVGGIMMLTGIFLITLF